MSTDLTSFFKSNEDISQVVVARQVAGSDASFITSSFIGHCVRNKQPVFLILLHHSLMHYHNVGLRMFYNLKTNIENKTVTVYNLAQEVTAAIIKNEPLTLKKIQADINKKLSSISTKYEKVHVIVDGVTHLFDSNFRLEEINRLCVDVVKKVRNMNSIVLFCCDVASDEDNSYILTNLLSHIASSTLQVEALPSGLSADVSGHLTVTQNGKSYHKESHSILEIKPIKYHFKLFDKGVKLFAPGAV